MASENGGRALGASGLDAVLSSARSAFALRRRRAKHFHSELFGEGAWDALLLLFVEARPGIGWTTTAIAEAIGLPTSTTVRWLGVLRQESLVELVANATDETRFAISARGRASMVELFSHG
ncbi:MAG: helix-turn-helix domain-containing protein [Fimbriimonadaceae bacterium]